MGARCEDDRNMWIAGFRYIIASTVTVQNLMRENDMRVERKLKKKTEKMHATGVIDLKTGNHSIGRSSYEDKQEEFNKVKKATGAKKIAISTVNQDDEPGLMESNFAKNGQSLKEWKRDIRKKHK